MHVDDASLMDPAVQENPYAYYEALVRDAPVYLMPDTGYYLVSGYEELRYVIDRPEIWSNDLLRHNDASMFQSAKAAQVLEDEGWARDTRLQADPPEHGDYRSVVQKSFTAGRIKKLALLVQGLSASFLR